MFITNVVNIVTKHAELSTDLDSSGRMKIKDTLCKPPTSSPKSTSSSVTQVQRRTDRDPLAKQKKCREGKGRCEGGWGAEEVKMLINNENGKNELEVRNTSRTLQGVCTTKITEEKDMQHIVIHSIYITTKSTKTKVLLVLC